MLRQIKVTVRNYEREHFAERSATCGEQSDLHEEWSLPEIPDLTITDQTESIGKYGRMRKNYRRFLESGSDTGLSTAN
ncbi:hypothetical protein [Caproicibacter sp.]|uniref:hypothetical protein n=1 Tax=Caproicibacter sp. TaxID=2814884 RepID=UPI003989711A